jgi:septal ring factor EnvC (AmiA/AmiB activator)
MSRRTTAVTLAAAAVVAGTLAPVSSASAAPCASRAAVHQQIHALRADMRDQVKSQHARSATAEAVHEVIATFRGAQADNSQDRQKLGREISARLKELHATHNQVEKKALGLQVKALRQQRQKGKLTSEERSTIKAAFAALKSAVVKKAHSDSAVKELQGDFKALRGQISC